jgi:polysaccharide deacetylase family protein (PEP-CTERM system associated)
LALQAINIMTVDVEDWYQSSLDIFKDTDVPHGLKPDISVVENTLRSLNLLASTGNKATFFVLGTVAQHFPDLVKEIMNQGHEVATHGFAHQLVYNLSPQQFEEDLKVSLDHLSNAGCRDVLGYRAPYWSITEKSLWALEVLHKLSFRYDSSIFPIKRKLYGIPNANPYVHEIRGNLWEFPPATIRMFGVNLPVAGGGYLRIVPYWLITSGIRKSSNQVIRTFYFHPYELDPTDVKMKHKITSPVSILYRFQQLVGRGSNPDKLERLLSEFRFTSISETLPKLCKGE